MQDMLQLLRPRLTVIRLGAGKEKAPPPEETLDTFRAASGLEPAQVQQARRILPQATDGAGCSAGCGVTGCTLLPAPIWLEAGTGTAQ